MDRHKIENFIKENPDDKFPWFEAVEGEELENLKADAFKTIERKLGVKDYEFSGKFEKINKKELSVNAESEDFRLDAVLSELKISTQGVAYVNWYRFDRIDKINLSDLCNFFGYMWYPGSDDIEIFDENLSWMLSISHGGQVSLKFGP